MENKAITQKEYLKKYISLGHSDDKKKKKKKKKLKVGTKTVKIIDDDIDLNSMRPLEEGEFHILLEGEDAPQIAGIVDERGPVDFSDKRRWKIITENEEGDLTISNRTIDMEKSSLTKKTNAELDDKDDAGFSPSSFLSRNSKNKRSDVSPHRHSKGDDGSNLSPPRRSRDHDSDLSPPRRLRDNDSDLSPPRRLRDNDSDLSPPRRPRDNDSDLSPPRQPRKDDDSDLSPPRRRTKHRTAAHATSSRNHHGPGNSDSDLSPPRERRLNLDADLYESRRNKKRSDSDLNASRRREHHRSYSDNSSRSGSRKTDREYDYSSKHSSKSSRQDVSRSSKREREHEDRRSRSSYADAGRKRKSSRWDDDEADSEHTKYSKDRDARMMTKTLDGKAAGLQDAKAVREETEIHKRREQERFSKLSNSLTGYGQAPVVRDKSGRKRNLEAEAEEKRQREIQQQEINAKYSKWGKGLKQVEDREEKLKDDLYEMNKPLARYADDADLDKQMREQEREGDPMLAYIKEKRAKEGKGKPESPRYQGSFAPNRFGIEPGHRWDGVDRSNGYEKKWFEAQNSKVARQEEAYKWSTADM